MTLPDNLNVIEVGFLQRFFVSLRLYRESNWGWRLLGKWRYAVDFGHISIVLERYWH